MHGYAGGLCCGLPASRVANPCIRVLLLPTRRVLPHDPLPPRPKACKNQPKPPLTSARAVKMSYYDIDSILTDAEVSLPVAVPQ